MNTLKFSFGCFSILGSKDIKYGFIAEDDSGFNYSSFEFDSIESLKIKYPTRLALLSAHEEALCYSNLDYLVDEQDRVSTPNESHDIYNRFGEKHNPVFKDIIFVGDGKLYS